MTIRTELNPYLETLGLLYLSAHPEKASRSFLVSEGDRRGCVVSEIRPCS